MGGLAFGSGPNAPFTPRMPNAVYVQVRDACHATLREHFVYVATPIPSPEKTDHGDIDILVALERRTVFPHSADDTTGRETSELITVAKDVLGAEHSIVTRNSANLAIPWPEEKGADAEGDSQTDQDLTNGTQEQITPRKRHIQVDVQICANLDQLCWLLFKHAHGDIWNLLGSTIRPFGLTVDEDAMWLRIPEIEKLDRKKSKIMLTKDPVELLRFLGLEVEGFWEQPFDSVQSMFDYVTTCRLFWVRQGCDGDAEDNGITGGEEGRKKLKANDRRRMNGRPVYRKWINEFIPQLQAEGKFAPQDPTMSISELRAVVSDEAFAYFHVEGEYRERLREWRIKRGMEEIKGLIRSLIPAIESQLRACVISALRKIILEDDETFGVIPPSVLKGSDGIYDVDAARSFIAQEWEQIGQVAWSREQGQSRQHLRIKERKRKV